MGSAILDSKNLKLYKDDLIGLRQIWTYLKTGELDCGENYKKHGSGKEAQIFGAQY